MLCFGCCICDSFVHCKVSCCGDLELLIINHIQYNDIISCFAAKSLNREFVYNDILI